jgi:hypothetical protein
MNQVTHPEHTHEHRVWFVPDSPLGRWAAILFSGAAVTVILAPLIAAGVDLISSDPGSGTPWFFALWGAMLVAITLGAIAGAMALVAMIRDHALLLLIPIVLGIVGTAALVVRAGWPI